MHKLVPHVADPNDRRLDPSFRAPDWVHSRQYCRQDLEKLFESKKAVGYLFSITAYTEPNSHADRQEYTFPSIEEFESRLLSFQLYRVIHVSVLAGETWYHYKFNESYAKRGNKAVR